MKLSSLLGKSTLAPENLSVCQKDRHQRAMVLSVRFARKVVGYPKAVWDTAVCHTVTESGSLSSVGITTRCRQIALPISSALQAQVAVTLAMHIAPVQNLATKILLSFTKPALSIAFSARIGTTASDINGDER